MADIFDPLFGSNGHTEPTGPGLEATYAVRETDNEPVAILRLHGTPDETNTLAFALVITGVRINKWLTSEPCAPGFGCVQTWAEAARPIDPIALTEAMAAVFGLADTTPVVIELRSTDPS